MRSSGWVLIQHDWFPYRKRKLGHRHSQRQDDVKKQREKMALCEPRREACDRSFLLRQLSEGTDPANTLILDV